MVHDMLRSKDIHIAHMTIEIVCAALRAIWVKYERVLSKNVFRISWPSGGAIQAKCEKMHFFLGLVGMCMQKFTQIAHFFS